MKKTTLLKTMLLLCALIVGSSSAWAEDTETTYTFSSKSWAASPANWTGTKDGNQFNSTQSPAGVQVCTGQSGVVVTSPKSFNRVKQVVVTYTSSSKGVGSIEVKVGSTSLGSKSISKSQTGTALSYNASKLNGNVSFTVTCTTNSIGIKSIKIVEAAKDDAALSFEESTPSVQMTREAENDFEATYTQTASISPADYDGTISYSIDYENSTLTSDVVGINGSTGEVTIMNTDNVGGTVKVVANGTSTTNYNEPTSANYMLTVTAAPDGIGTPVFTPGEGEYYYGQTVTITSANAKNIYYTTDGITVPTTNSTLYTEPIAITATTTIKAKGFDNSNGESEVATATFTLKAPEVPTFSIAAGNVAEGTAIELTPGTGGTKVVYTTDGSAPTASSTVYSAPITINIPITIKAATVDDGDNLSEIAEAAYTIIVYKETVLWSEDFSEYDADDVPSGGVYNYTCINGESDTKIYTATLAGGTSPELLVSKKSTSKNGLFQATIPLDNIEGSLTLTYKTNNTNLTVSATYGSIGLTDPTLSGDTTPQGEKKTSTVTISGITKERTSLTIKFENNKSSNCRLDDIVLTYSQQFETTPVTISAAEYATYSGSEALDFSETGITAFTATDNENSVSLNEITSGKVPANTPVILYKAGADGTAINVPVIASADAPEGTNDLHVVGAGGLTGVDNVYVLSQPSGKEVGFYLWDKTQTLNPGKIYLQAASSSRSFLGFEEGNTTSIDVRSKMDEVRGEVYNLNGQRVAQPTKGLYIVNGKKVVVK